MGHFNQRFYRFTSEPLDASQDLKLIPYAPEIRAFGAYQQFWRPETAALELGRPPHGSAAVPWSP